MVTYLHLLTYLQEFRGLLYLGKMRRTTVISSSLRIKTNVIGWITAINIYV